MAKILVERPRTGGCGKERIRQNRHETRRICKDIPFEEDWDTPDFRGMKRVHTSKPNSYDDKKQLNENLNPLRRFLNSRIGQPWDKVYSEIMSGLNLNNAVQYHVWQHLIKFGEVETKTYMEGNTVMAAGIIGPQSMTDLHWREEFYVDPRDGTLRKTKNPPRRRREKKTSNNSYFDPKKPLLQYHKIGKVWYEFKFREATAEEKKQKSFGEMKRDFNRETLKLEWRWSPLSSNKFVDQIVSDRGVTVYNYYQYSNLWDTCGSLFGGPYLPTEKRQISSKEIRKIEEKLSSRKSKNFRQTA